MTFIFNLTYHQKWKNVSYIRHFVTDILNEEFHDLTGSKRVSIATSELIENLVKHSSSSLVNISIKKDETESIILIKATNTVSQELLERFESIFKEIYKGDPKTVYKEMMLRSLGETNVSQLGLARIRYECDGEISYEVSGCSKNNPICESISETAEYQLLTVIVKVPILNKLPKKNSQEVAQ